MVARTVRIKSSGQREHRRRGATNRSHHDAPRLSLQRSAALDLQNLPDPSEWYRGTGFAPPSSLPYSERSTVMKATPDRPSVMDLERLERALNADHADRAQLAAALGRIEQALREHGYDVDRAGGMIDEDERVARPSLERKQEQLREQITVLADDAGALRHIIEDGAGDEESFPRARG